MIDQNLIKLLGSTTVQPKTESAKDLNLIASLLQMLTFPKTKIL
jgi:hypothetical protein